MTTADVAECIRSALVEAALRAYDEQGLWAEGRWEAAVDALRSVDLAALLLALDERSSTPPRTPA